MEEKILIKSESDSGIINRYLVLGLVLLLLIIPFIFGIYFLVMSVLVKKTNLTVTNKKVYGKCPNSPQVNIPIKNISAVATFDRNKTLSVTAANGLLSFPGIKNYQEIKEVLLKLIEEKDNSTNLIKTMHLPRMNLKSSKNCLMRASSLRKNLMQRKSSFLVFNTYTAP